MVGQTIPLLSADVVAEMLGLSRTAVYSLCDAGLIQHYRIGAGEKKRFRFSAEQVEAYLKSTIAAPPATVQLPPKKRAPAKVEGYRRLRKAGYRGK